MVKLLQTMHTSNHVWGELDDPSHRKLNLSSAEKEFLSRIPRPLSLEGQRQRVIRMNLLKKLTLQTCRPWGCHGTHSANFDKKVHKPQSKSYGRIGANMQLISTHIL